MKKIKAWFVHSRKNSKLHGMIALENGWTPWTRVVPEVGWIKAMLWESQPEREEIFETMGYELVFQNGGRSVHISELPREVLEKNAQVVPWEEMKTQYMAAEKEWMRVNKPLIYQKTYGDDVEPNGVEKINGTGPQIDDKSAEATFETE